MDESKYCECNIGELDSLPKPVFRLVCHCKTCQQFFRSPFNDECTFFLKDCKSINLNNIEFRGYQKGYSPIKRGTCKSCGKLSYCRVKLGPFKEFIMVSSERISNQKIPDPFVHIYYDSRQKNIETDVKKINGHFVSQIAILWAVIKSFFSTSHA